MKSQEQIAAKIIEWSESDWLGIKPNDLIGFLDFEHAKPFLKPETTPEEWKTEELTRESVLKIMEGYMSFAWDKAKNKRGLSAGRSMLHFTAWTWLIGDEEKFPNLEEYENYGKDNLKALCENYGWDWKQWAK